MLFGVGCTPDAGGNSEQAQIAVDPVEASLDLDGGVKTVTVASNAAWVVECNAADVEYAPEMGNGNGTVTVNIPATTTPRTVVLTFTAKKQAVMEGVEYTSKDDATVTIYQNAGGEVVEGGIASITTTGNYDIQGAWVVAASSQSFVMTDKSGAYILVYMGTNKNVPAVGTVVNVSGEVTEFGGLLQFGTTATVNVTSETVTVNHGTPKILSYNDLTAYVNNPSIVYAEMKGLLVVSYGTNYNNYNIVLDGGDTVKGLISYAPTAMANELNALDNTEIVVRGYMVGHPKSNTIYANMVVTDYEVDSTSPILRANDIYNVPAAGVTNANETITALNVNAVTATADGVVVTSASVSGDVLTYSVSANAGEAREGSITLSATGVESVTIKVSQLGAVASTYTMIDKVANISAGTYLMAGYSEEYYNSSNKTTTTFSPYPYHFWTGAIVTSSSNKDLATVDYSYVNGELTIKPDVNGVAGEVELVAVEGKTNTFYIKYDGKYLTCTGKRTASLVETPVEWVFTDHTKGGIMLTDNGVILGTAGAASNLLRCYVAPANSLVYGVAFFKKN